MIKDVSYKEVNSSKSKKINFDLFSNKISFESSSFRGKGVGKSFIMGFGANKQTGEIGIRYCKI